MIFFAQYAIFFIPQIIKQRGKEFEDDQKYSEEKRKTVIEARKAGLTIAQIAIQIGVGRTTVKAWLKDTGLQI